MHNILFLQFLPKCTESEKLFTVSSELNIRPNAKISRNIKNYGAISPSCVAILLIYS